MADIEFVGHAPRTDLGNVFNIDSDWWYVVIEVINGLMKDKFPVDERFYEDCIFCPPTPHFDDTESLNFSAELSCIIDSGSVKAFLKNYYDNDPLYIEYFDGDQEEITFNINERIDEMEALVKFLKDCGGCDTNW